MADITIDETTTQFAKRVYPLVLKMKYFALLQQQMYDAFVTYKGDATKEIEEYSQQQIEQINIMCQGYFSLANSLIRIIEAFQGNDEASKKKIEEFYIHAFSSVDEERRNAVIASFEG